MAEQYLIEVSEKLALLIKGTRVNGHDKISINSLYKKGDEWIGIGGVFRSTRTGNVSGL